MELDGTKLLSSLLQQQIQTLTVIAQFLNVQVSWSQHSRNSLFGGWCTLVYSATFCQTNSVRLSVHDKSQHYGYYGQPRYSGNPSPSPCDNPFLKLGAHNPQSLHCKLRPKHQPHYRVFLPSFQATSQIGQMGRHLDINISIACACASHGKNQSFVVLICEN